MNSLTQVRNYVANNFSKEEQDLFDFIVESFPEAIITQGLTTEIDTSRVVESINEFTGDVVKLTADDVLADERAGVSVEDALISSLAIDLTELPADIDWDNEKGGSRVGSVNYKDGEVTFTTKDLPFSHFATFQDFQGADGASSSRTVENFLDNHFIFDEDHVETTDVYLIGDSDPTTDVMSINNLTGRVALHAKSIYYGDTDTPTTLREKLYDILSLEGIGAVDNIGKEQLSVKESQDVLLLLAVLAKVLGTVRERISNLVNSKDVSKIIQNIKNGYLVDSNKTLLLLNYLDSKYDIIGNYKKPIGEIYAELSTQYHMLESIQSIDKWKGTKTGFISIIRSYLLDLNKATNGIQVETVGKHITYTVPNLDSLQQEKLLHILAQIKPAGYTHSIAV